MGGEDILDCPDTEMVGGTSRDSDNFLSKLSSLPVVLLIGGILGSKMHGLGEKGDQRSRKPCHLLVIRAVLFQFFNVSEKVGIAVL